MNSHNALQWLPSYIVPFVSLSYPTPPPLNPDSFHHSTYYKTGVLDGCFIITCIAIMAVLRDVVRIFVMEPFARWKLTRAWERSKSQHIQQNGNKNGVMNGNGHAGHANGDSKPKSVMSARDARKIHRSVLRFAEQGWSAIYYTLQWSFGFYVHRNLPTQALNPTELWSNYPHSPLAGPLKFYYLTQTAFYLHQILILNAEARRKDHVQMMTHHVLTIFLMVMSYFCNFTRIGCLIMVLMDWNDIFLPIAKMFRYIGLYTLCDITFTWFLTSWFVARHVLFVIVIKSAWFDGPRLITVGWVPELGHYYSERTYNTFVYLLVALQFIQIIWFWMICRVAWRVISGQGASDDRSDDESEEDKKSQ
ncbi:TLC domain-containing protein [Suillus clintonianus]|uniref:TLC domain-containing protein n=1 Tax=Suillus clintonianus TaxID=1904413 RepID=UPI001B8788A9|nr:TLC domain-containing protein [Suillus clintonianus]KAG2146777.1 TLC domain-containing protein [Suillus clintonianus]